MAAFWDKFRFSRKPRTGAAPEKKLPGADKKSSAERRRRPSAEDTGEAHRVLLYPLVSEKAARLGEDRQYVFVVAPNATRIAVSRALFALYGVRPEKINILRVKGKRVRFGRTMGREKDWKKAVVSLPPGESIALYEGV